MYFLCPSVLCGIWQFGAAPSLSTRLLSPSIVYMSGCVTQSGSPGVRVSEAQCVSCCQEEKLRVQRKIKEIISDFGLTNREQHDSSGELQFEQPLVMLFAVILRLSLGDKSFILDPHSQ